MNNLPVHVLADAKKPTMSEGRPLVVDRTEGGEVRESTTRYKERSDTVRDSRGGQNTFVVYRVRNKRAGQKAGVLVLFSPALPAHQSFLLTR